MLLLNSVQVTESISGSVVPLAMFLFYLAWRAGFNFWTLTFLTSPKSFEETLSYFLAKYQGINTNLWSKFGRFLALCQDLGCRIDYIAVHVYQSEEKIWPKVNTNICILKSTNMTKYLHKYSVDRESRAYNGDAGRPVYEVTLHQHNQTREHYRSTSTST